MGYPQELFLHKDNIDEEFLCTICHDVLQDPSMINDCQHIFCTSCILRWRKESDSCPTDRKPIKSLTPPIRSFINLLNRLQLHCGFSSTGCQEIISLGDAEHHHDSCEHNQEIIKPCRLLCGAMLKNYQITAHVCTVYLNEQLNKKSAECARFVAQLKVKAAEQVAMRQEFDKKSLEAAESIHALKQQLTLKQNEVHRLWLENNQLKACSSGSYSAAPRSSTSTGFSKVATAQPINTLYPITTKFKYESLVLSKVGPSLVLVHFHAPGCQPCLNTSHLLRNLARMHTDVWFLQIDINVRHNIIGPYQMSMMPRIPTNSNGMIVEHTFHTVSFFKHGQLIPGFCTVQIDRVPEYIKLLK